MKRMIMSISLMAALCFATGASAQSDKVSKEACKKECVQKCDGKKMQAEAVCGKKRCAPLRLNKEKRRNDLYVIPAFPFIL